MGFTDFLDKMTDKVAGAANKVEKSAGTKMEIMRLKERNEALDRQAEKVMAEMGKAVYALPASDPIRVQMAKYFAEIDEKMAEKEQNLKKIEELSAPAKKA